MEAEVKQWLKKIEELKKGDLDLSRDEDLSIALMNLISLEEHFYFTAMKTDNQKYLEMLNSVRETRKNLLKRIVISPEGEEWCISKHLLAASMRLIEVGTKELSKGNTSDANVFFKSGFELYSLFFAINLKLIDNGKADKVNIEKIEENKADNKHANGMMSRVSAIIKRVVDCCRE